MINCEICQKEKAKMLVVIEDSDDKYPYKNTYRCEKCAEIAERSYEKVTITKL